VDLTSTVILALTGVLLVLSVVKDRKKTVAALRVALNAAKRLLPSILAIILAVGLMVGFVPAKWISQAIGADSGALGVAIASLLGAVLFIPAIIAFPLARSLLDMGAGLMATAAFITTLTMVGFVFLPLEIKELGTRFAIARNALSFIAAICIAIVIGLVLA
jgi:uncharacterized membrane protein YraQ (UPF0718 family)